MITYNEVVNNITKLTPFILEYEKELIDAKKECKIGGLVERQLKYLPGYTEHRFNQLQEIEAVLSYLNTELRRIKQKHYKKYLEAYAKALSSRDAEKYAYAEDDVIEFEILINGVALLRNKYLGIIKAFESLGYNLSAIARLKIAGMEDIST